MAANYVSIIACLLCIFLSFSTKPGKFFCALGWLSALLLQIIIIGLKGAA